jgi:chemotaxis protein CheZ
VSNVANQADQILQAVSETIRLEIGELRTFVDRRIAELSTEVHATVELMDFSENHLSSELVSMREQISSLIGVPVSATRNSGLELEAVVQATEAATNRIMTAAERMSVIVSAAQNAAIEDPAQLEQLATSISDIFEACTFQDVTGQRIRRAIGHLQQLASAITDIAPTPRHDASSEAISPDLLQDAVDALFD